MKTEPSSRSKIFGYSIIYLIIGIIVGGFIAVQIVSTKSIARSSNPIEPVLELGETIERMRLEQKELKDEISMLRTDVSKKENQIKSRQTTSAELSAQLSDYEKIVGLLEMRGPGVEITLDDGDYQGLKDRNDFKNDAIIHATDILDVINILWLAGAEAIAINDERVVGKTSVNCIVNTILVNEAHVGTPLQIRALGNSDELAKFIDDPGRLVDLHSRMREYGLIMSVDKIKELTIPAYSGTYEI
jgi:uncharacterized protein YlxW (UPF0749 family)